MKLNADYQIKIEKIKVKELYKFACQIISKAKRNDVIPISKDRAIAYANNPYADENDVGLIAAYIGDKCIGYLGLMPGLLKAGDKCSKIHWFSTWYVQKRYRSMSVGAMLLINVLSLKYDIAITGLNRASERILRGMRLQEINPLTYCVINSYRVNPLGFILYSIQKILNRLGVKQTTTNVLFKIPEYIFLSPIKKIFYSQIFDCYEELSGKIRYQEVNTIDEIRIKQFESDFAYASADEKAKGPSLAACRGKGFGACPEVHTVDCNKTYPEFYRGVDVLNWMLKYKWIPEFNEIENKELSYYFSNVRNISKFIALNIYSSDEKKYKGYLILSVNSERLKTVLKVLDFCFYDKTDLRYVLSLAIEYAKIYLADYIEFPESLRMYVENNILMRYLTQKKKRVYFYHSKDRNSPLATSAKDISLNYCDGDTAFT